MSGRPGRCGTPSVSCSDGEPGHHIDWIRRAECADKIPADVCRSLLLCTWGSEGASSLSPPNNSCVSCPALQAGQSVKVVEYVCRFPCIPSGKTTGFSVAVSKSNLRICEQKQTRQRLT